MSDTNNGDMERENCWFLKCKREPEGVLYKDDGFSAECCEEHGKTAESHGWDRYVPADSEREATDAE